jgi:hypothetical protein
MRTVIAMSGSLALLLLACAVTDDAREATEEVTAASGVSTVPWSVSRHVWPAKTPADEALLARDLNLIAEVGARFVRADAWWYAIEPERGVIDANALASYGAFFAACRARGLEALIVLSNAPAWARELYERGERTAFFDAFERYAAEVAKVAGSQARYYQLWNEPNHVLDFVDGEGDVTLFARGRAGIHRGLGLAGVPNHRFTTMLNVLVDGHDLPFGPSWQTDVDFYLERAASSIDVIGIDHYPGTWSVGSFGGNIIDRLAALGRRWKKAVAVLEIGLATPRCTMPWNDEDAQARWINSELPLLRAKTRAAIASGVRVEMLNWFRLDDRNTGECFDPENHFGLVHTDRTKKPAFDALRHQIDRF